MYQLQMMRMLLDERPYIYVPRNREPSDDEDYINDSTDEPS